jgi:hypothetical protein
MMSLSGSSKPCRASRTHSVTVEWPAIATVTQTEAPISSGPNMTWTPTLELTESGGQC